MVYRHAEKCLSYFTGSPIVNIFIFVHYSWIPASIISTEVYRIKRYPYIVCMLMSYSVVQLIDKLFISIQVQFVFNIIRGISFYFMIRPVYRPELHLVSGQITADSKMFSTTGIVHIIVGRRPPPDTLYRFMFLMQIYRCLKLSGIGKLFFVC